MERGLCSAGSLLAPAVVVGEGEEAADGHCSPGTLALAFLQHPDNVSSTSPSATYSLDPIHRLPQMIHTLVASTAHAQSKLDARRAIIEREFVDNFDLDLNAADESAADGTALSDHDGSKEQQRAQLQDEALRSRLEGIGFKVGWALAER